MDYMGKQFFQSFDCIVKPAGFERYSHGYIRIVNDVMQGFELYRSSTGRTATLRFDIIPICSSFSNFSDIGFETYSVCQLIERIDPGEPYTPRERSEIDKCIIQLKNKYVSWLHPLFQKTESCESAFPNILERKHNVYGIKSKKLGLCITTNTIITISAEDCSLCSSSGNRFTTYASRITS